jgi:hypothetical protein
MKQLFIISTCILILPSLLLTNSTQSTCKLKKNPTISQEEFLRQAQDRLIQEQARQQAIERARQRVIQCIKLASAIQQRNQEIKRIEKNENLCPDYKQRALRDLDYANFLDQTDLIAFGLL